MAPHEDWWTGLVDDTAALPPDGIEPDAAIDRHRARTGPRAHLVRSLAVRDADLPSMRGFDGPVSIVSTGGAGQIQGALRQASKLDLRVVRFQTTLRDLDDLAGNARRVTIAVESAEAEGLLGGGTDVYVELPATRADHGWSSAADELAAMELRLAFRTSEPDGSPTSDSATLVTWIEAALDRETPFACTHLPHAVTRTSPEGVEEHGFLNVLLATLLLFDGDPAGRGVLEERDAATLVELAGQHDLTRARRWFTSFGSHSVDTAYAELLALGLRTV